MISVKNVILPNKPLSNFELEDAAMKYKNGKTKIYFDSYGVQPPLEVIKYSGSPIHYNTDQLQPPGEVFCGHLCLYVLKELSEGREFLDILNKFF